MMAHSLPSGGNGKEERVVIMVVVVIETVVIAVATVMREGSKASLCPLLLWSYPVDHMVWLGGVFKSLSLAVSLLFVVFTLTVLTSFFAFHDTCSI